MKKNLLMISIIAGALIGCNTIKKSTHTMDATNKNADTEITNTIWELATLEGVEIDQSATEGEKIGFNLNSTNKTISGYAGCNIFNGKYTIETGNRIKISSLVSTRMACRDATINESEILKVFELTDNFTIHNGTLSLNVGKRAALAVFKNVTARNPIVEKYWKLKTLEGQAVEMTENQEREIFFTLKTNKNSVTGFAGCNTLSGEYVIKKGNRIHFNNMAATLRACPDVPVDEAKFLKVFELADTYKIDGDTLSLKVGKSKPVAVFEAVYFN